MFLHFNAYPHPELAEWKEQYDLNYKKPTAELWTVEQSCKRNMGSGAGYILTRHAAKELLRFVNQYGMPNAVDWVIMKQSQLRIMYSNPMLVFADCWQNNGQVQSDIQLEYNSVKFKDQAEWLDEECKQWARIAPINKNLMKATKCPSYTDLRSQITILPMSLEIPNTYLVKWYQVGDFKIVVPDNKLRKEIYNQYPWGTNRLNGIVV